jgi:hypothetical protein
MGKMKRHASDKLTGSFAQSGSQAAYPPTDERTQTKRSLFVAEHSDLRQRLAPALN